MSLSKETDLALQSRERKVPLVQQREAIETLVECGCGSRATMNSRGLVRFPRGSSHPARLRDQLLSETIGAVAGVPSGRDRRTQQQVGGPPAAASHLSGDAAGQLTVKEVADGNSKETQKE